MQKKKVATPRSVGVGCEICTAQAMYRLKLKKIINGIFRTIPRLGRPIFVCNNCLEIIKGDK